jgi:hypothetical protein
VQLAYLNLSEPVYPLLATNTNAMDLILCRNVAIYYSEEVIRNVAARFHRCLSCGGWLMMAAAETGIPVFDRYTPRVFAGGTVFQKSVKPSKSSGPLSLGTETIVKSVFEKPAPERAVRLRSEGAPAEAFPHFGRAICMKLLMSALAADPPNAETPIMHSNGH